MATTTTGTGVLILAGNRTYAQPSFTKSENNGKNSGAQYYKCVPRNKGGNGDAILVAYSGKSVKGIGFNKVRENLYILFDISEGINGVSDNTQGQKGTIQIATLKEVIGPVSSYDAFQIYEMYSRGIYNSLSAHNKHINARLSQVNDTVDTVNMETRYFHDVLNCSVNRDNVSTQLTTPLLLPLGTVPIMATSLSSLETKWVGSVITIDPKGAKDLDDALTIRRLDCGDKGGTVVEVSVYISLVAGWVDYLDDWQHLCNPETIRVSTIYLPNGETRPIFPTTLSHNKMSLLADGLARPVMATTFIYDANMSLIGHRIGPEMIVVDTNFVYDSPQLEMDGTYRDLIDFTRLIDNGVGGTDSHKLVEYWMKQTGLLCGKTLFERKLPAIFRQCIDVTDTVTDTDTDNIDVMWKSYNSQYVFANDPSINIPTNQSPFMNATNNGPLINIPTNQPPFTLFANGRDSEDNVAMGVKHDGLDCVNYVHITSPIRRWIDIWNQSLLLYGLNTCNKIAYDFLQSPKCQTKWGWHWVNGLELINAKMREIQKTQRICTLMHTLSLYNGNNGNNGCITTGHPYFDDVRGKWQIYLPEFKCWMPIHTHFICPLTGNVKEGIRCKLVLFEYEHNVKKKVRVIVL